MKNLIQINENDNIVVALTDLSKGEVISIGHKEVTLKEDIKRGHKIAIKSIKVDDNIVKYGFPIGHSIIDISKGQWVHTHNIKTNLDGIKEYTFNQKLIENSFTNRNLTFNGYKR